MIFIHIFLFGTFLGGALFEDSKSGTVYEYKFRTAKYIKEVTNVTTQADPILHICRLPNEERIKICENALLEEFSEYNNITMRKNLTLGEEKMYEIELSGVHYTSSGTPPITISACMCPTGPPIYLRDDSSGKDVRVYVDLHVWEDENGFTTPWE